MKYNFLINRILGLFFNLSIFIIFILPSPTLSQSSQLNRYQFSHPQMGTTFNLIFYAQNDSIANLAAEKAKEKIDQLNHQMSDYLPESELNTLCKLAGKRDFKTVSDDLWDVLKKSKTISKKSKGIFDPTIGPLSRLWRRAMRRQSIPSKARIESVRSLVDYRFIKMNSRAQSIRLKKEGIKLDLGGIAKGYAVDAAFQIIKDQGISALLVDGGGDLRMGNSPPQKKGWTVEISGLNNAGESFVKLVQLSNCAIATSGAKYKYVEANGKRYSHIIHPKTGMGITERRLVSIIAPDCTSADALASIVSIAGLKKGKKISKKIMGKQDFSIRLTIPEQQEFKTYYYHNN